jgi:hypothetical protein
LAKANATKISLEGEAEASKETNIGLAKARAIDAQVKAYGGAEYRVIQEITDKLADAIKNSKVDIVPKTVVNMGSGDQGDNAGTGTIVDSLLKFITLDKLGVHMEKASNVPIQTEMKDDIDGAKEQSKSEEIRDNKEAESLEPEQKDTSEETEIKKVDE